MKIRLNNKYLDFEITIDTNTYSSTSFVKIQDDTDLIFFQKWRTECRKYKNKIDYSKDVCILTENDDGTLIKGILGGCYPKSINVEEKLVELYWETFKEENEIDKRFDKINKLKNRMNGTD